MKFILLLLFFVGYASAQTLLWSDEFNGPAGQLPDSSTWGYDLGNGDWGWGNAEHQYYTNSPSNVAQDGNGHLVITARRENVGNCWNGPCQYTSARILSYGRRSFTYGRIEARMRLPIGQAIWPAFWMLGSNLGQVGWPQCGEIDIMENIGSDPLYVHGTLHGPGYSGGNGVGASFHSPNGQPFANDFHVYRIDWTPAGISWYVDGVHYSTKTAQDVSGQWVFNQPFFIILNLAVGGQWPGVPDGTAVFPQTLTIDYVRVYNL